MGTVGMMALPKSIPSTPFDYHSGDFARNLLFPVLKRLLITSNERNVLRLSMCCLGLRSTAFSVLATVTPKHITEVSFASSLRWLIFGPSNDLRSSKGGNRLRSRYCAGGLVYCDGTRWISSAACSSNVLAVE